MAITNADILTYIRTNRLHSENSDYLLQGKIDSMGADAVSSARAWLFGRFYHADRVGIYNSFIAAVYTTLDDTDLTTLDTIRAAFVSAGVEDVDLTVVLFDSMVQLAISNIYESAGQEGAGLETRTEAVELISSMLGMEADANVGGAAGGAGGYTGEAVVGTSSLTDDEMKDELWGYE